MVDIAFPRPAAPPSRWLPDWSIAGVLRTRSRWLLLFTLLFVLGLGWAAAEAMTEYQQKRCDSPLGKLAVGLKLDTYYSNCHCRKSMFDFGEPCNLIWLPGT